MRVLAVLLAAIGLALFTYAKLERLGRAAWPAMAARAVAWAAIGLLLLNLSCPTRAARQRPLVLLDASLSMRQDSAAWRSARARADSLGEVRFIGDDRPGTDSLSPRGRSEVVPALASAAAQGRTVVLVTDGEVDDAAGIPVDVANATQVEVRPRTQRPDLVVAQVSGPARATVGDTVLLEADVVRLAGPATDSLTMQVSSGAGRVLAERRVSLRRGNARVLLRIPTVSLAPGEHLLQVRLAGSPDHDPRTDLRLHHLVVAGTPGVVLVASPADWDARFLFRTLADVSALPVRGFVELGSEWRAMGTLLPVSDDAVRRAIRGADLLVLKGRAVARAADARGRALWLWPSGAGSAPERGDWYLTSASLTPLSPALAGVPLDSFPPTVMLTPVQPPQGGWVGLMAQVGRRGAPRPAMTGVDSGRRRTVTAAVDGLWRWAFRGGSSEQGYRALVASTVNWLLASPDSARGIAAPVRPVVQDGRPVGFSWVGPGAARPVGITWSRGEEVIADSLRFDGGGRATAWLPQGEWRYRLDDGAGGLVGVEPYSDEYLPRAPTLVSRAGSTTPATERRALRDWWWLFLLAVAALAAEWTWRRKHGLR